MFYGTSKTQIETQLIIITSRKNNSKLNKKIFQKRRKKLSERLNQEEAMYHQELINNQEFPEDVRRRMEIKLKELRE